MTAAMGALRALHHWRSLPFPIRMAVLGAVGLGVITVSRWLGIWSVVIAAALWLCVAIGLLYASDRLRWIDRQSLVSRVLSYYAPRVSGSVAQYAGGAVAARAGPNAQPAPVVVKIPDISGFVGIETVRAEMERLATSRALQGGTHAPATMVVLVGPRGTGKSDLALALAARLRKTGALASDRIMVISRQIFPGLGDVYGPGAEVLQAVAEQARASLEGALLIDDLDWLASVPGAQTALEVGTRLLGVARADPGKLFVITSASAQTLARIDPEKRWLGQFNLRRIECPHLDRSALAEYFLQVLQDKKLTLDPPARRALDNRLKDMRTEAGEEFQNVHAIGQLVDAILSRLPRDQHVVGAADIRDAELSV